jgi:hypothetical protein
MRSGRIGQRDLAVDAERLPARGHDPHPRAIREDPALERGGRLDDMLAVIENHHLIPVEPTGTTRPALGASKVKRTRT